MREVKECFTSANETAFVEIYARVDGLFSFTEWNLRTEEDAAMGQTDSYWLPVVEGGLFQILDEAINEARNSTPWLREPAGCQ